MRHELLHGPLSIYRILPIVICLKILRTLDKLDVEYSKTSVRFPNSYNLKMKKAAKAGWFAM